MSFGLFESAVGSELEQGITRQASVDAKAAAVYDVREQLGPVLFASRTLAEFRSKSAMMRSDGSAHKIIGKHLPPITGTVRSIIGNGGELEKEFKAILATGAKAQTEWGDTEDLAGNDPGSWLKTHKPSKVKQETLASRRNASDDDGDDDTSDSDDKSDDGFGGKKAPPFGKKEADFDGTMDNDATFSPSDSELKPEGNFDAYLNSVDQNGDKVQDRNFTSSLEFQVYADWAQAHNANALSLDTLDHYATNLGDSQYLRLARAIQAWEFEHKPATGKGQSKKKLKDVTANQPNAGGYYGPGDYAGNGPASAWNDHPEEYKSQEQIDAQGPPPGHAGHPQPADYNRQLQQGEDNFGHYGRRDPLKAYISWCQANDLKRISARNVAHFAGNDVRLCIHLAQRMQAAIKVARQRQAGEHDFGHADFGVPITNPYTGDDGGSFTGNPEAGGQWDKPAPITGRRRQGAPDHLQKAQDALTQLLNQKAEEFQETIAPLQQALVTVQQATQLQQQQNPMNVLPPPGTVNVLPGQAAPGQIGLPDPSGGQDPQAAAAAALAGGGGAPPPGGDPSGGGAPGGGMPMADPNSPPPAAGGAPPPDPSQQLQARRRRSAMPPDYDTGNGQHAPGSDSYWDDPEFDPEGHYGEPHEPKHHDPHAGIPTTYSDSPEHSARKRGGQGKGQGATRPRQAGVSELWNHYQNQLGQSGNLGVGGDADYEDFANKFQVGPRALQKLKTQHGVQNLAQPQQPVMAKRRTAAPSNIPQANGSSGPMDPFHTDHVGLGDQNILDQVGAGLNMDGWVGGGEHEGAKQKYLGWCTYHGLKPDSKSNYRWYEVRVGRKQRQLLAEAAQTDHVAEAVKGQWDKQNSHMGQLGYKWDKGLNHWIKPGAPNVRNHWQHTGGSHDYRHGDPDQIFAPQHGYEDWNHESGPSGPPYVRPQNTEDYEGHPLPPHRHEAKGKGKKRFKPENIMVDDPQEQEGLSGLLNDSLDNMDNPGDPWGKEMKHRGFQWNFGQGKDPGKGFTNPQTGEDAPTYRPAPYSMDQLSYPGHERDQWLDWDENGNRGQGSRSLYGDYGKPYHQQLTQWAGGQEPGRISSYPFKYQQYADRRTENPNHPWGSEELQHAWEGAPDFKKNDYIAHEGWRPGMPQHHDRASYSDHYDPSEKLSRRKQAWMGWGPAQFPKRQVVAGWDWDNHLNGYLANSPRQFECGCGEPFPAPSGFHRCACGKQWNSYVIGTGGSRHEASAEKFLVREIPTRENVIVANRQLDAGDHNADPRGQHAKPIHDMGEWMDELVPWGAPRGTPPQAGAKGQYHADPGLIPRFDSDHGDYKSMHYSPGPAPLAPGRHRALAVVDPKTGAMHSLIDPGQLGEGDDAGTPSFREQPKDWANRGDGAKWLKSPIGN